jgi:hypothetical protein
LKTQNPKDGNNGMMEDWKKKIFGGLNPSAIRSSALIAFHIIPTFQYSTIPACATWKL